jgi:hypothetical protein
VSKRAVDAVFESLFQLTDLRFILRETSPGHELDSGQRDEVAGILEKVRKQADIIEKEMLG